MRVTVQFRSRVQLQPIFMIGFFIWYNNRTTIRPGSWSNRYKVTCATNQDGGWLCVYSFERLAKCLPCSRATPGCYTFNPFTKTYSVDLIPY
jgi:hypothetical protein